MVSMRRISKYLSHDDLDPDNVLHVPTPGVRVSIENGSFQWDPELGACLKGIDLTVRTGQLLAVVGQVGCGKSSLISAILGDMEKTAGVVNVSGKVAFVPQEAWIQNATVRDNIIFGLPFDNKRYKTIIKACALIADFEMLPAADLTEIGEKGINLSGGQKQRVSLARAVYSNADIFLLDDPLSAVDAHVGKHIFEHVLCRNGLLANKTCILVTHGIHWLPQVNEIIVLVNGEISESGSYTDLVKTDGAFAQFLLTYQNEEAANHSDDKAKRVHSPSVCSHHSDVSESHSHLSTSPGTKYGSVDGFVQRQISKSKIISSRQESSHSGNLESHLSWQNTQSTIQDTLVEEEYNKSGGVEISVYLSYFKAMGTYLISIALILYAVYVGLTAGGNVWLSQWTDNQQLDNKTLINGTDRLELNNYYLGIYGCFGAAQSIILLISAFCLAVAYMRGSLRLHDNMLYNIIRCAMSFFDTTPSGRILNRFSKDMDSVDEDIPDNFMQFVDATMMVIMNILVISASTPIFLSVIIPTVIIFALVQRLYLQSSRQLKRLESRTKSPVFNHFSESIAGAAVIRAYGVQERFIDESQNRVDYNTMCLFYAVMSNRWLGIWLNLLGNLVLYAAALVAVAQKNHISSGIVGLIISYALEITDSLTWSMRMASDLETNIVAIERIKEYTEVKTEAEWLTTRRPPPDWPNRGQVTYNNYSTRYRPGLDLVLDGINLNVPPGQRVGIVGRTGAGKSSMMLSLFRIIESAGGSITVDGWNIADMGLHDLRQNLTILPQDPVLFSGSLRMNLDPLNLHSDDQVWQVLEHAHLKTFILTLPEKLEHECGEGGSNLSVGQKQLVCLARSLLRKTKVLILDEATAAVDMETDELIQQTIRTEFSDCTILTIAHRLNTILDYDKVLVLDRGVVKEFDTPTNLLNDKNTIFYQMASSSGIATTARNLENTENTENTASSLS